MKFGLFSNCNECFPHTVTKYFLRGSVNSQWIESVNFSFVSVMNGISLITFFPKRSIVSWWWATGSAATPARNTFLTRTWWPCTTRTLTTKLLRSIRVLMIRHKWTIWTEIHRSNWWEICENVGKEILVAEILTFNDFEPHVRLLDSNKKLFPLKNICVIKAMLVALLSSRGLFNFGSFKAHIIKVKFNFSGLWLLSKVVQTSLLLLLSRQQGTCTGKNYTEII